MLVVNNGITGLCLVIAILFLFLNTRVAAWVTLGIPVSFLAALSAFWFLGGSMNFISLVGAVMALGIVVDDAIVVGEHALARFEAGASPAEATASGAQRMFAPVVTCVSRLRPVMLTSITTTLGLAPMMLESCPMAEAMAPIAVVICSGLLYGTGLILITIPAILSLIDGLGHRTGAMPPLAARLPRSA